MWIYFVIFCVHQHCCATCSNSKLGEPILQRWTNHACFTIVGVSVASSVFTIMMLSLDRYLAIRHPMTFRAFSAGRYSWLIVLGIWILSFRYWNSKSTASWEVTVRGRITAMLELRKQVRDIFGQPCRLETFLADLKVLKVQTSWQ